MSVCALQPQMIPTTSFLQILESFSVKTTQNKLLEAYRTVCIKDAERMNAAMENGGEGKYKIDDSLRGRNYDLNRYSNVLPFNSNRVRLSGKMDYINATHISLPEGVSARKYIATQGPLNHSIDDFWRMIWEHNVKGIVMLTKNEERGRNKCAVYWPDMTEESLVLKAIEVTLVSEETLYPFDSIVVRKFSLKHKGDANTEKTVTQLHYKEWPDEGVPTSPVPIIELMHYLHAIASPDPNNPIVVHCSAGVGRTGTFILLDTALEYFKNNHDYSGDFVVDVLIKLRKQRTMMIQSLDQFIFCYQMISYMVRNRK